MGLMSMFLGVIIAGIFVLGLIVLIIACLMRQWKVAKWTIAIAGTAVLLAVVGSAALIYFVWRPYDPTSEADLKDAYRADFGVPPPAGITVLKARQVVVGDAGGQWLLLKASPEEIERHIAKGFTAMPQIPNDFNGNAGANAPPWWAPPVSRLKFYENMKWTPLPASSSTAAMGVDSDSGLIWFVASQSD